MHHTRLYYSHFSIWCGGKLCQRICAGRDSPHHSAALTPSNNKPNLHFSASLSVVEWKYSKKKYSRVATDVLGDRSQRRGAVANFMPCIFLSCMANSRFRPARWNARPCDLPHFPPLVPWPPVVEPELYLYVGRPCKIHNTVCFYTALIQREPDKTKGETVVAVPFGFATLHCLRDVNDYPPPPPDVPSPAPFVI